MTGRKVKQPVHVCWMTEHVYGQDGGDAAAAIAVTQIARFRPGLAGFVEKSREFGAVDAQGPVLDVDEQWRRAAIGNRVGRRDEGQRRTDHRISVANAGGQQCGMKPGRAVDHGDAMGRTAGRRGHGFEALDELAGRRDPADVQAFLNIGPFPTFERRFMQRNAAANGQVRAQKLR